MVSMSNESVRIAEGGTGVFCAVIEDSTAQLDRDVIVELFSRSKTARGKTT